MFDVFYRTRSRVNKTSGNIARAVKCFVNMKGKSSIRSSRREGSQIVFHLIGQTEVRHCNEWFREGWINCEELEENPEEKALG